MQIRLLILLIFLSLTTYAQIPDWVIDSLTFEAKQNRQRSVIIDAQQTQITALNALILEQARQLGNYKVKDSVSEALNLNLERQIGTIQATRQVEKTIAKTRLKSRNRWLGGSVGLNVVLILIILL